MDPWADTITHPINWRIRARDAYKLLSDHVRDVESQRIVEFGAGNCWMARWHPYYFGLQKSDLDLDDPFACGRDIWALLMGSRSPTTYVLLGVFEYLQKPEAFLGLVTHTRPIRVLMSLCDPYPAQAEQGWIHTWGFAKLAERMKDADMRLVEWRHRDLDRKLTFVQRLILFEQD